jgi:hypothetical protein
MNPTFIMRNEHSKDQAVNDDETKTIQIVEEKTLENLETKIGKLLKHQPPFAIAFHEFKIKYKLPRQGINPHKIKNKDVDEAKIKEVFGAARGRSGFSFTDYHDDKSLDRIKEIYPIIYGKDDVPKSKLIGKEFAKGIVVEVVKGRKVS